MLFSFRVSKTLCIRKCQLNFLSIKPDRRMAEMSRSIHGNNIGTDIQFIKHITFEKFWQILTSSKLTKQEGN